MEDIIPIIIIVGIVMAIVVYAIFLNARVNNKVFKESKRELSDRRNSVKVARVAGFIPPKNHAFYEVLKTATPDQYIIIPNVAVELLFRRTNRRDLRLEGQYVDICIFTPRFVPILVINLRDFSAATDMTFQIADNVREMIKSCGIPIMDYDIRDAYSIDDIRRSIAKAMNPLL